MMYTAIKSYPVRKSATLSRRFYGKLLENHFKCIGVDNYIKSTYGNIVSSILPSQFRIGGQEITVESNSYQDFYTITNTLEKEHRVLSDLISTVSCGDVFFDIGAHIGAYSLILSNFIESSNIYSFEPAPERAIRLEQNVRLNDFSCNVKYYGLSNEESLAKLSKNSSTARDSDGSIPLLPGDRIVAYHGLESPNIIKIDVEGAELKVIRGFENTLSSETCTTVYCEVHEESENRPSIYDYGGTPEDLENILRSYGFKLERLMKREDDYILKGEK